MSNEKQESMQGSDQPVMNQPNTSNDERNIPEDSRQASASQSEQGKSAQGKSAHKGLVLKLIVLIVFIGMVIVNALASLLPLNGMDTGAISDSYPDLFAPAGVTFAIWGLIYFLLLIFTVFQFFPAENQPAASRLKRVQIFFIISSLANIAWIFAWHWQQIGLSLIFMIVILLCLILTDRQVSKQPLTIKERLCLKLPFSIYFGWISVATVANVTTFLVSIDWNGFGLPEGLLTSAVLIVATIIALLVVTTRMNWAYGAVFVWAYAGIIIKHLDAAAGFGSQYIEVIITASVCLGLIAAASLLALFGRKLKLSPRPGADQPRAESNH